VVYAGGAAAVLSIGAGVTLLLLNREPSHGVESA
jgi:hypothetical protein